MNLSVIRIAGRRESEGGDRRVLAIDKVRHPFASWFFDVAVAFLGQVGNQCHFPPREVRVVNEDLDIGLVFSQVSFVTTQFVSNRDDLMVGAGTAVTTFEKSERARLALVDQVT
jgi:hypothetical protein